MDYPDGVPYFSVIGLDLLVNADASGPREVYTNHGCVDSLMKWQEPRTKCNGGVVLHCPLVAEG